MERPPKFFKTQKKFLHIFFCIFQNYQIILLQCIVDTSTLDRYIFDAFLHSIILKATINILTYLTCRFLLGIRRKFGKNRIFWNIIPDFVWFPRFLGKFWAIFDFQRGLMSFLMQFNHLESKEKFPIFRFYSDFTDFWDFLIDFFYDLLLRGLPRP